MLSDTDLTGEPEAELEEEYDDEEEEHNPANFSSCTAAKAVLDADPVPIELSLPPKEPLGE